MLTFFLRLGIVLIAVFCMEMIAFAFGVSPFIVMCIFVCSWLTIVSFRDIFWWIFTLSIIFGLLYYDVFGLFTISIIFVAFIFNLVYVQAVRSANNMPIILYGTAFTLTMIIVVILEFLIQHYLFFNLHTFIVYIIVTFISFFLFRFAIGRVERFIDFYTHGIDMRCHT